MSKTLVLYASLSGHNKSLGYLIFKHLKDSGKDVTFADIGEQPDINLADFDYLVAGSSTYDEGKLANQFTDYFYHHEHNLPNLSGKKFAVFACGEKNYDYFCGAADVLEQKFSAMGSSKMLDSLKIDGDPEANANGPIIDQWAEALLKLLV